MNELRKRMMGAGGMWAASCFSGGDGLQERHGDGRRSKDGEGLSGPG